MKKQTKSEEAMEKLMKCIDSEVERYDSLSDTKERRDAAQNIADLANQIQKLEETTNAKRGGTRDFWLKVGGITAETGLGVAGLILTQKNMKFIRTFEEENVIRTDVAKAASKAALGIGERAAKILRNFRFW